MKVLLLIIEYFDDTPALEGAFSNEIEPLGKVQGFRFLKFQVK